MASKKYVDMGEALGEITQEKNEAYGDSFSRSGEIMVILYPNGIQPSQYRDALGVVRVIDKLFRIATRKDAFGESPWRDIGGYGIVGAVADRGEVVPSEPRPLAVGDRVLVLPPSIYAGMEGEVAELHVVTSGVRFEDTDWFVEFPNAYLEKV